MDILLCPPPRERSPSFVYGAPKKKGKKERGGSVMSSQPEPAGGGIVQKMTRNVCRADLLVSLLSRSSPTPLSPRSPAPIAPPSLSFSFSPCRLEQVRLRRRRDGGVLAASAPMASPAVTTETSFCSSVSSLHTSLATWGVQGVKDGVKTHTNMMPEQPIRAR